MQVGYAQLLDALQESHGSYKFDLFLRTAVAPLSLRDLLADVFLESLPYSDIFSDNGICNPHKALFSDVQHLIFLNVRLVLVGIPWLLLTLLA